MKNSLASPPEHTACLIHSLQSSRFGVESLWLHSDVGGDLLAQTLSDPSVIENTNAVYVNVLGHQADRRKEQC